jgi:hypothetical protein
VNNESQSAADGFEHLSYRGQLRSIASVFEHAGFPPSVRGDGEARFVYAEHYA